MTLAETTICSEQAALAEAASRGVVLYQPFLGEGQRNSISAGSMPFDITFNTGPDTREYECFQALHARHLAAGLGRDVFWGLISSKFDLKAAMPLAAFRTLAEAARTAGFDCWAWNPMLANAAIYENVWQQGILSGHTGMEAIAQHLGGLGYPIASPQGTSTFFLCNYVCGNQTFWDGYFAFCGRVLAEFEAQADLGTTIGQIYKGSGGYKRDHGTGMRPFLIERLLGLYFEQARGDGLKIGVYAPAASHFSRKFGERLGSLLHRLCEMKTTAVAQGDSALFVAWHEARLPLLQQPTLAIHADDPPAWLANAAVGGQ